MKNAKKYAIVLLLISLLILALPVSANAYQQADHLRVSITNLPEGAVYADILIVFPEGDPNYVSFQSSAYGEDPALVKEIADYNTDGYQSFTIHYKNAQAQIKLELETARSYFVEFWAGESYEEYLEQYNDLRNRYGNVKIALLDKDFKILSVSDSVQLPKESIFVNFNGYIEYDARANTLTVETMSNPWFWLSLIIILFIMIVSVCAECIVALIFGIRGKAVLTVLVVNLCTHAAMRALHLALPLNYWVEVGILGVLVVVAEFLIYNKRLRATSAGKILAYTLTANFVSLLLGIALNVRWFS